MNRNFALLLINLLILGIIVGISPVKATGNIATSAFIIVAPNPAKVGQQVQINMLISPSPPTLTDVFHDIVLVITSPDGTNTALGPYDIYSNGPQNAFYTPTLNGKYQLQLNFSGQAFANNTVYYQSALSPTITLTVTKSTPTPTIEVPEGSWIPRASMHQARGGLGVAVVNGKIYAIGGSTQSGQEPTIPPSALLGDINIGGFVGTNEEYDPATDVWTYKAPMPTPRILFATAVYQNKVYCIGGRCTVGNMNGGYTGVNEVYDPVVDKWETKASMPTARGWLQANVVGDKIYLMGGDPNANLNEVYDPATNTWTTKAPMPTGTSGYASVVVDNKIYVVGGFSSNLNQIYDPVADKWNLYTSPPSGVAAGVAAVTIGVMAPKRIYLFDWTGTQVYDYRNDSWTIGVSIPTLRVNFGIAVINDRFYAIGGLTYNALPLGLFAPSVANEQFTPAGYGIPDSTYQTPSPSPSPTPSSSPSQPPTPSPSISPATSPRSAATTTASPSPPSPTLSLSPTPTPSLSQSSTASLNPSQASTQEMLYGIAVAIVIVVMAVVVLFLRKMPKKRTLSVH